MLSGRQNKHFGETMDIKELAGLRRDYRAAGIDRQSLHASPFRQFESWLAEVGAAGLLDITAMVLATVNAAGAPLQRTVLLKGFNDNGFIFFTNNDSRKARDIVIEKKVSLLFPWQDLDRQVIVSGEASPVSIADAADYFASRPRSSQLAAWSSPQSRPIANRSVLLAAYAERETQFEGGEVPMPDFWGGYLVRPVRFEFWQGRENRLHDRYEYTGQDNTWRLQRLAP